ncbi:hypothetical protein AVEN_53144-1 [Araneus ventricosus]|uniref:Uncharacterized protein n=1 Tax=Araneus ventricosus TaxID=182803 RepID=A0A4Y2TP20_ARAVE|nr:hypothetical protein AVEN_53144-1 [Araneus ventricosus]
MEFQPTQNPRFHLIHFDNTFADSNLRPRCEASSTSNGLPTLEPRIEARKSKIRLVGRRNREDRRATVAHFGAYVNDMHNFSIKMAEDPRG